jgi:uncharacterized protein (DUF2141 family)
MAFRVLAFRADGPVQLLYSSNLTMKFRSLFCLFWAIFLVLFSIPLDAQGPSSITVRITGFRNSDGFAYIALYDQPDGFPAVKAKALRIQNGVIRNGEVIARFAQLPPGTYAIITYHDENANGVYDMNVLGLPKEGWGASNDPRPRIRAPRFDEAKFEVSHPEQTVEIKLCYPLHGTM